MMQEKEGANEGMIPFSRQKGIRFNSEREGIETQCIYCTWKEDKIYDCKFLINSWM